jgi:hypothetical protein
MPPRRSARVAAAEERQSGALAPLPPALTTKIFLLLPVDERARCACVCRSWRAALDDVSLWTRLDLSRSSGVAVHVTDAVLDGAAALALGTLQALDITGCTAISPAAFLAWVTCNGGTLREVRSLNAAPWFEHGAFEQADALLLLRAAPTLRRLELDVASKVQADTHAMLRNEGVFAPLCVRRLWVGFGQEPEAVALTEADVLALAADVAAHASLTHLLVCNAQLSTAAAVDALVDAALARSLRGCAFLECHAEATHLQLGLARLLRGGALTELWLLDTARGRFFDAAAGGELCSALRSNTSLNVLTLEHMGLCTDPGATALLRALTAHASVQQLAVRDDMHAGATPAVAAAFGELVAANAPALHELDFSDCRFGQAGLRPLLQALPENTYLRSLTLDGTVLSEAFARDVLLPAVRANTSLLQLVVPADAAVCRSLREALDIVQRRR